MLDRARPLVFSRIARTQHTNTGPAHCQQLSRTVANVNLNETHSNAQKTMTAEDKAAPAARGVNEHLTQRALLDVFQATTSINVGTEK